MKERLLLHHCCAPCSVKAVEGLGVKFQLEGFWFNPNVHPPAENGKRRRSMEEFASCNGIKLHFGPEWEQERWERDAVLAGGSRCGFCYTLRLRETAALARSLGIKYFSTSLLSSPYQKHDLVRKIGAEAGEREKVQFWYEDFRPGYYEGKNEARASGYYMQKYCGCSYSIEEREKEKCTKGRKVQAGLAP